VSCQLLEPQLLNRFSTKRPWTILILQHPPHLQQCLQTVPSGPIPPVESSLDQSLLTLIVFLTPPFGIRRMTIAVSTVTLSTPAVQSTPMLPVLQFLNLFLTFQRMSPTTTVSSMTAETCPVSPVTLQPPVPSRGRMWRTIARLQSRRGPESPRLVPMNFAVLYANIAPGSRNTWPLT